MGPPPAATPSQKRRPDNVPMPVSRPPSAAASEVIEVDKSPPSRIAIAPTTSPNIKPHSRTKSQQAGSFGAGLMQYQSNPSSAPLQQQTIEQQQHQQHQQPRTKTNQQQVRPRLGYFADSRGENQANIKQQTQAVKSRQPSHSRTNSQSTQYLRHNAPQQVLQQETGLVQQHQMQHQQAQQTLPPRGDYQKHVILQQEQAKKQEARYHQQPQQHQRSNSQTIPLVQQHEQMHSGVHSHRNSYSSPKLAVHRTSITTPPPSSVMPTSEKPSDQHIRVALSQEGAITGRQSQSNLLQLIDPTPSSTLSGSSYQLSPRPPQRVSSPALEPILQAQMQGRPHTGPPSSTMPLQKPPEPRRTSNLASILNSEPEEPRPRRNQIETASAQSLAPPSAVPITFRRRGAIADLARSQEAHVYEQAHLRDQPFSQSHNDQIYVASRQPSSHPQSDAGRETYPQPASTGHTEWSQPVNYYHHSNSQIPIAPGPAPTAYDEVRSHSYQSSHSQPPSTNQTLSSAQNRQNHQPPLSGSAAYGHPYSSMSQGSQAHHLQQQLQQQSQVPSRMGHSPESFARSRTPSYTQPVSLAVHNVSGPPAQAQILQPAPYSSQGGPPPSGHRTSSGYDYRYSERERPRDREQTRPDYRNYEREREHERGVLDLQQDQPRERDHGRDREHEQYEGHRHAIHPNHRRLRTSDVQQYSQFSGHQHPHQSIAQAQVQPPSRSQSQSQQRCPPEPYPGPHQAPQVPPGSASLAISKNHSSLPPQPLSHAHPHPSQQQQQGQQQEQQPFAQPHVGYMSGEGRRSGR